MKNFYLCFSIMFLSVHISYSQNEYYVATRIEELMNEEIFQWVANSGGVSLLKTITIEKNTDGNKFVNFESSKKIADRVKLLSDPELAILDTLFQFYYRDSLPTANIDYQKVKQVVMKLNPQANLQAAGSLTGFGVSQSEIITAIADVVVERAKQELATMYFDKLAQKIDQGIPIYYSAGSLYFREPGAPSTSHTIALDRILPNTYSFLRNSADRMTPEMGQTFKNAFTKDLETLFPSLIEYGLPNEYKQEHLIDDFALSSYGFIMSLIGNAGFYVASDELFASLITNIPTNTIPTINSALLTDVLSTVRVLNSSLVNTSGAYEINAAHFRSMNPATFTLYLNLMSSNPNLPVTVRAVLQSNGNRDQFNRFVSSIDQVRLTLDEISDMKTTGEKINAISLACNSFLDGYGAGIEITRRLITVDPNSLEQLQRFANYSRRGVEFSTSMYTQNYANSALVALNFIRDTYADEMNKDLFKYITLIADISHAQNTQEVRTIVDRAILPVGSYAIKRSTGFSVAVNAYAGVAGGLEWTKLGDQTWSSANTAIGFSLPIGISINWSAGDEDNMEFSNTFFLSLLDLGAIANYNLGNTEDTGESISTAPEITFANVFSPGISYIYGWKNSPISTSLGLQYMPNLREITDASNIVLGTADAVQFKIGILVDVPLFNIVMKGRK